MRVEKKKGKGPIVIEFNLSKVILIIITTILIISAITTVNIVKTITEAKYNSLLVNENIDGKDDGINLAAETAEDIGKLGYISFAQITEVKTGVGPFDSNNEPGNDSSEDNNIVRSFDQITYTIENTMTLKENVTTEYLQGGILEVKATLPDNLKNVVKWDIYSMLWAEDGEVSEDGTTFTAHYSMPKEEITIPGKQTIILVLAVKGATNGTEIVPTFQLGLLGNSEEEKVNIVADTVYVSAAPSYNIKLDRNAYFGKKTTVDLDGDGENETTGRMYGYSLVLQLYNQDSSKGLKGIEYPTGNITFDIDLKFESSLTATGVTEDITDVCTPVLWNYKVNSNLMEGNIANRTMYFGAEDTYWEMRKSPNGVVNSDRSNSIYNSGKIAMNQENKKIKVTVSDYSFDETFPIHNKEYFSNSSVTYGSNIGCFGAYYFQILVPYNEESLKEDRSYYLTVSNSNFSATSITGKITTSQIVKNDDEDVVEHTIYKKGEYLNFIDFPTAPVGLSDRGRGGDMYAAIGSTLRTESYFSVGSMTDEEGYPWTVNKLFKFDGDAFYPQSWNVYANGTMEFRAWYLTKKDGTNWTSQEEMNKANIEDLLYYETLEEIPENDICIGMYCESTSGYLAPQWNCFRVYLEIKSSASIGKTYGMTHRTQMWISELDRQIYTLTNMGNFTYPTATWDSGNYNYVKTEYNENGSIKSGTHNGGHDAGNSVLIIGGDLNITKTPIDSDGNAKINYDFSKNEYDVTYKIEPQIVNSNNIATTDTTLKIEDTLPKGMTYVTGSCEYGEPEKTENSDGTTKLIWYMYGVTIGEKIDSIIYKAHLDEMLENGEQLSSKVLISEVPDIDTSGNKIYKIGNKKVDTRTYETAVQIINLASYRLYKEVETPIIEKNGEIHYKITYKNNTDSTVPDFAMLDIMPYNGDDRGTTFNGTYEIKNIVITQNVGKNQTDNSNLKLYITQSEEVKNEIVKNIDLKTDMWQEIEEVDKEYIINKKQENNGIIGMALEGELKGQTEIIVDIYVTTQNNAPEDVYINSVSARTQSTTEEIQSSKIMVQVIEREISGKIWLDENYNNVIDNGEGLGTIDKDSITINLYKVDEDGNLIEAIDINGNIIEEVHPTEMGEYCFCHLGAADYVVKVEYDGETYNLVKKEIGANIEINSKFEAGEKGVAKTESITKLKENSSSKIEQHNVNLGLYKNVNFEFTKVTEESIIMDEDGKVTAESLVKIGGTEFKLYKLKCTTHEKGYHDNIQIDIKNVDSSCWELVGTQKSSSKTESLGKVTFENLDPVEEYRLIETKASLNRIRADGQWKIEFIYGDYNKTDTTIIEANGELIRTSAVGNPPAFVKCDGEILLPNRIYFEIPISGNIGVDIFYKIGAIIVIGGMMLLITRKIVLVKTNTKSIKKKTRKSHSKGKH